MTLTSLPRILTLCALALSPLSTAAQAQVSNPVLSAEILPGWTTERGTRMAALHLVLAPGWHTYWRNPGEAGIAPRFDWGASQNVASVRAIWPRPQIFDQNGYRSYGYEDELLLPVEVTPQDGAHPMALLGALAIGVCADTCVPADVAVQGVLRGAGEHDRRITTALDNRAEPGAQGGVTRATCQLHPGDRDAELTLRTSVPSIGRTEAVIVEVPGYRVTDAQTRREGGDLVTQARLRAPRRGDPMIFDRASIVFTVLSEEQMLVSQGCTGG